LNLKSIIALSNLVRFSKGIKSMSSTNRKTRQKESLRGGILQAARKIATQEGWQAVTIRKIADEIEYTPPIVYEYFANKEAVFYQLAIEGFNMLRSLLEAETHTDPSHRLMGYARVHWQFANEHTELYKLMYGIETIPSLAVERPQELLAIGELIKNTILAIAPALQEKEVKELFFQWMCIVNGFITMALIMQEHAKESKEWEPEQFLERANRRFIKSLQ
jgi:AcrR family transcriptional regulator